MREAPTGAKEHSMTNDFTDARTRALIHASLDVLLRTVQPDIEREQVHEYIIEDARYRYEDRVRVIPSTVIT
jgi:hypothetical protein